MSHVPYSTAVGSLMYAIVCTMPDLLYVVSVVSRYMHNPGRDHWETVKWILRHVKGSINKGLVFDRNKTATWDVIGFVNSHYAGDLVHFRIYLHYVCRCYLMKSITSVYCSSFY